MASFIIVLTVIVAILLGLVVLVQNPKGGGLATGFQGAAQVGGVQRTADFLEKATWYLAIGMFILCLASAHWYSTPTFGEDDLIENTGGPAGGEESQGTDGTGGEQPAE